MGTSKTRCRVLDQPVLRSVLQYALVFLLANSFVGWRCLAQEFPPDAAPGGVYIDASGTLRARPVDDKQLEDLRAKARTSPPAIKDEKLCYISLPKLMEEVRT